MAEPADRAAPFTGTYREGRSERFEAVAANVGVGRRYNPVPTRNGSGSSGLLEILYRTVWELNDLHPALSLRIRQIRAP